MLQINVTQIIARDCNFFPNEDSQAVEQAVQGDCEVPVLGGFEDWLR